jgi:RNA polymerase sigma-70 factor (ECF subfamily)
MEKEGRDIQMKLVWDRMKSGDEQSLSEIFTFFYPDLYHYGIKIYNLPDLVKDSIQDVFVRIWEKRQTIGDVQHPKAYLISSVRRKLFANKESYRPELPDDRLKNEGTDNFCFEASEFLETEEISNQLRQALIKAMNNLPERQRELIFLRFYHNLHYLEIAHIMEVNEQSVRNLMQRTLAKLRGQIDRRLWEEIDNLDDLLLTLFLIFRKIN